MSNGSEEYSGKTVVVTGGSRGIGRAIGELFAARGAHVVINYVSNNKAANDVVDAISTAGGSAQSVQFDVSNSASVDAAFKQVLVERGSVDVLVNNAGIALDGLAMRMSDADWQRTLDINLSGCFYCARAAVKPMLKARAGRIINVSSVVGSMGNAGQSAYAATKAALFGFTKSLAKELGSRTITVNAIAPGYIDTDMTSSIDGDRKGALLEAIPLARLGTPKDVACLAAFLASQDAGYITGQVIGVNGGLYM